MNYTAHFKSCLDKYPECRKSFFLICDAWKRYGRLPQRIVLQKNVSSIEEWLSATFGPANLYLSKNGAVSFVTANMFGNSSEEDKILWVKAIYDAVEIQFSMDLQYDTSDEFDIAVKRWKIMFPQLSELTQLLSQSQLPVKEQFEFWVKAAQIVSFLLRNNDTLTLSDLGARCCNDSKALRSGELINTVADWIAFIDTGLKVNNSQLDLSYKKNIRQQALENRGIVENRGSVSVTVYGPLLLEKRGQLIGHVKTLWGLGEAAILSLENLDDVEINLPPECLIFTCENESPFSNLVRRKTSGIVIYTRGFPNSAVRRLYSLISSKYPSNGRFHWGDTDLAGLQIASILHGMAPLQLWRCDLQTVSDMKQSLIQLNETEKDKIRRFLDNNADFVFRDQLEFTLKHGWLEQERFQEYQMTNNHGHQNSLCDSSHFS
jgi:hypothetical protein